VSFVYKIYDFARNSSEFCKDRATFVFRCKHCTLAERCSPKRQNYAINLVLKLSKARRYEIQEKFNE